MSVDVIEAGGAASMKWGIAMVGEYNQRLEKGTLLLLKLEDGTILNLPTTASSSPVTKIVSSGAGAGNIFTTYYLNFDLPKETISAMAKSRVTDIKVDVQDQNIKNPKIKDRQMEDLQDLFKCLDKG